jgi:hypothetical protein
MSGQNHTGSLSGIIKRGVVFQTAPLLDSVEKASFILFFFSVATKKADAV